MLFLSASMPKRSFAYKGTSKQKKDDESSTETTVARTMNYQDKWDEEAKNRAREAYNEMMGERTKAAQEINEMVNVYFKRVDKNEEVSWDDFDDIVQQALQFAMENQTPLSNFIQKHEEVVKHFERRASRHEFPALKYIIYLNFACVITVNGKTIDSLLRYGTDEIYPRLQWPDKLQIIDTCNRANMPYKQIVFNKVAMDLMLADHTELVLEMNLEGIIQMIAHMKTTATAETIRHSGRAELWNKMQTLLVKAFEWRHEDFEYAEASDMPAPVDKNSILLLASVLIASETTGHLRDPAIINYLFKSVYELTDIHEDGYQ